MVQEGIRSLVAGRSLTQDEAASAAEEIMTGVATPAQIAGLLVALRIRGETPQEMAGMAKTMRAKVLPVIVKGPLVDIVGTGGDAKHTFNISTAAAFVGAAVGLRIAKHGNRAASGSVGSADILESQGVKIELSPEGVRHCIEEVGVGFMFAQAFHPAMRFVAVPRRELGIRTVFNILGPLTNPAGARHQIIGAPSEEIAEKMAQVLRLLGTDHSWVVYGGDGLDEITTTQETLIWDVSGNDILKYQITPETAGLTRVSLKELQASSEDDYVSLFLRALSPEESAPREVVLLNAAAALVVANAAPNLSTGVGIARKAVESGASLDKLHQLARTSQLLD